LELNHTRPRTTLAVHIRATTTSGAASVNNIGADAANSQNNNGWQDKMVAYAFLVKTHGLPFKFLFLLFNGDYSNN
jgi:hypothetical protein